MAALLLCLAAPASAQQGPPYVVALNWGNMNASTVAGQAALLETTGIDGVTVSISESQRVMTGQVCDYQSMFSQLSVLTNVFTNVRQNYVIVYIHDPGDVFDDAAWAPVIACWRDLARAIRDAGLVGIMYDNEEYGDEWLNFPEDGYSTGTHSLAEYQAQTYLRGKQVMAAAVAEFPAIRVLSFHGPYLSEPKTPPSIVKYQAGGWMYQELMGPFFAGMVEATVGTQARAVDGGEVYRYREEAEFIASRDWRLNGMASEQTDCAFIPQALRPQWPGLVSISYGIYQESWPVPDVDPFTMDPTICQRVMTYALRHCDELIWFYTEQSSIPAGLTQEWSDAIKAAKAATRRDTPRAVISADVLSGDAPLTVHFDGTGSSSPAGAIQSYSWSFGDGQSGAGATVSHEYAQSGTYTAALTVTDSAGHTASASVMVQVRAVLRLDAKRWTGGFELTGRTLASQAEAPTISFSEATGRGAADNQVTVRAAWDEQNLYVSYEVHDTQLEAAAMAAGADAWMDDDLEVYLDRRRDRAPWRDADDFHFFVNLNGVRDDAGQGFGTDFQSEVALDGTLNRDDDSDNGYWIEVAVPWSKIGGAPTAGEQIGVDFCAADRDAAGPYRAFDWAGLTDGFAKPERWGTLRLVDATVGPGELPDAGTAVDVDGSAAEVDAGSARGDDFGNGACGCSAGATGAPPLLLALLGMWRAAARRRP